MKASTQKWVDGSTATPSPTWPCRRVIFTRRACDRIITYAFELARTRKKHVTSATKSNGIVYSMPFWDERFAAISKKYPDVKTDQYHIDILTAHFVAHPDWFDVVVGSNLFGDILSDLGAAVVGSMGLAPSANLNPEREYPSLFEPVHGSAPDIAGKRIANPVAQIWSGAMMLEHLGEKEAAHAVEQAIFKVLAHSNVRTRDIGGNASTRNMGEVIAAEVSAGRRSSAELAQSRKRNWGKSHRSTRRDLFALSH